MEKYTFVIRQASYHYLNKLFAELNDIETQLPEIKYIQTHTLPDMAWSSQFRFKLHPGDTVAIAIHDVEVDFIITEIKHPVWWEENGVDEEGGYEVLHLQLSEYGESYLQDYIRLLKHKVELEKHRTT